MQYNSIGHNMMKTMERLEKSFTIHYEEVDNYFFASSRRREINNTNFSIISNNCWGGHVYRRFGLEYSSPTVGLYFFSPEYMKLLNNLYVSLHSELKFINCHESKYYDELKSRNQCDIPIGLLNNEIEIMFLHYHDEAEAYEKWMRRCERVNFDNLIVKHSQMNGCTEEQMRSFDKLPFKKKVLFVAPPFCDIVDCARPVYKYADATRVLDDTTFFSHHVDLVELINR